MRSIVNRHSVPLIVTIFAVISMSLLVGGCGGEEFGSCWRQTEITVDGDNSEWQECITYFEDEKFAVGDDE